ncbi:MAG TPA: carbohydrate ABC transporter permease [Clostridia bacterium]|jgi:multiple sugar transport system permease protein|nr:carbohydrate ABC transporter permease [Clostridia bacterium]HPA60395.1 carbohydrate ABC transporter permease [Clostridia bacterium]HQA98589.1 carbohydrate ABC transporter permease [Clostridia bacterium]HQO55568.1 carbohydrate ABC transporter permease [Clostridia bacterium]HUM61280.1 carbohydrate ABC transporter permease [Clostridia bacterium]
MTSVRKSQLNRRPWLSTILLYLGVAMMLFPFVWMILSSFKTKADVYAYPPRWIPSTWSWDNYQKVFDTIPFLRYYWNSIFTSVVQTFLQVALSITAGYALTRIEFPGSGLYRRLMQSSMFVPAVVTMIPLYLTVASLRLIDTYAGIILPQIETAFLTMLLMSFFASIPDDLVDSANIDGCGYYRVLTNVIVPNSSGAIATATLFAFLGNWKSYTWPLIITNNTYYRTLPIGMKYLVQESSSEYQVMMAASVMAILPILITFMFTEKQLVRSVTLTGMK